MEGNPLRPDVEPPPRRGDEPDLAVALAIGARDWGGAQGRAVIQALLGEPVR